MNLDEYLKIALVDEALANECLLNTAKAQILQQMMSTITIDSCIAEAEAELKTELEKKKEAPKKPKVARPLGPRTSERAEIIAQLDDLGIEYSPKHATSYLINKLQKALNNMGLAPSKAEPIITKNPDKKEVKKDIINDILKETNTCEVITEGEEAYNLSALHNEENDW